MKKLISYILVSLAITANLSLAALAVDPAYIPKPDLLPGPTVLQQQTEGTRKIFTEKILPSIAVGAIGLVGGISLVFLVIGGVRFTIAYGNEESVTNAKNQIMYSIIGFIIALLAYAIVTAVTRIDIVGQPATPATTSQPAAPAPATP